jgi:hypothetical protein
MGRFRGIGDFDEKEASGMNHNHLDPLGERRTLSQAQWEALPKTWEEIIAVEPRLLALYDEALQACRENRGRRRQSGVMIFYRQFKPRVVALVGFGAVGERLYHPQYFGKRTPYDIAYEKILGAVCGSGRKRTRR